jgi:hypothetical protein
MMSGSSGKFFEYLGSGGGSLQSGGSGGSQQDKCSDPIETTLEEVQYGSYFLTNQAVPPIGEQIKIEIRNRIAAVAVNGGEIVGFLPVRYNYLLSCINSGKEYMGEVTYSAKSPPVPRVKILVEP